MVIGAGWEQERLVRLAKERADWVFATAWPSTYAHALPLADEGVVADPRDLDRIWRLAREHRIGGVVADQCDYSYFAAAYVAERLGAPGPGVAAAQVATNKQHQRERLARSVVRQPRFLVCRSLADAENGAAEVGFPAIVKPVDNRGNFGVNRVDAPDQVAEAFYEAVANAHSRTVLVEEFITGTMATVEGFVFPDGVHVSLVCSSKVMLGGRKRVAMELRYPGQFDPDVTARLLECNQAAIEALGYGVGPTHAEYMVTPGGEPYFIEAANRGGGVLINSHIVPALTGVDPTALMVEYAKGASITRPPPGAPKESAILSFFGLAQAGEVAVIEGLELARSLPGVISLRMLIDVGSWIGAIVTDAHRHGFVIARASGIEEAVQIAGRAKALVRVVVR
jgi:biotin carboxylase